MSYTYPDKGDKLVAMEITSVEPYPGYWDISERFVLQPIHKILSSSKLETIVDVGAGHGRLTITFADSVKEVHAIEPDHMRLQGAKDEIKKAGKNNVTFYQSTFLETHLPKNSADLILISHIIQHIPPAEAKKMVDHAYEVLKPGGYLAIMTSHSTKNRPYFTVHSDKNGKVQEEVVSEDTFVATVQNSLGHLPVRHFTIFEIHNLLSQFTIIKSTVFHELHKKTILDHFIFRDHWINLPFIKNKFGRDVFFLAKKS